MRMLPRQALLGTIVKDHGLRHLLPLAPHAGQAEPPGYGGSSCSHSAVVLGCPPSRCGDELAQRQRQMPADLLDRFGDLVKLVMRSDDPEYFPEPGQVLDRVRITVFV
jgi:hypothetical protein